MKRMIVSALFVLSSQALAQVPATETATEQLTAQQLLEQQLAEQQQAELEAQQALRTQLIGQVIDLSGLLGLTQQARNLAQQTLNDQQAPLGYQYQVASLVAKNWSPEVMREQLSNALALANEEQLQALQQLLSDQRLLSAREKENSAVADQQGEEFNRYVQKLRTQPPGPSRLAVITQLDQAMQFSQFMRQTRASVYTQLQAVLKDWQPAEDWQQALDNEVREFLLYTYRRTPNKDLNDLIALYQDQELQQWLGAVRKSLPALES